jgi:DNA-binding transcriptional MocR family regulator
MKSKNMTNVQELQLGALKNANVSFCTRDHFGRPNKDESDYYIRFAYSGISQNDINEGMAKLKNYFES